MADEMDVPAVKPDKQEQVRVIYDGPKQARCAGRVWEPGKAQNVEPECAEIALTHPLFRKLRVRR